VFDLLAAFPLVWPAGLASPTFPAMFCPHSRTIVAEIALYSKKWLDIQEFTLALCHEVSHENLGGQ